MSIDKRKKLILSELTIGFGVLFYFYYGFYKNLFIYSHLVGSDFKHGLDTASRYLNDLPYRRQTRIQATHMKQRGASFADSYWQHDGYISEEERGRRQKMQEIKKYFS